MDTIKLNNDLLNCKYSTYGCKDTFGKNDLNLLEQHYDLCKFENSKELKELRNNLMNIITEMTIGEGDCIESSYIDNFLINNQTFLKTINLWWKNLGLNGMKVLCNKLQYFTDLQEINLGNNELADEGAILFSKVLPYFKGLKVLDLSWNNISAVGMRGLVENSNFKNLNKLIKLELGFSTRG